MQLSSTVKYLLQLMVAAASCRLEDDWTEESRPGCSEARVYTQLACKDCLLYRESDFDIDIRISTCSQLCPTEGNTLVIQIVDLAHIQKVDS